MTIEDVTARLESLGYTATVDDTWMINYIMSKVTNEIKNTCNITEIPTGLNEVATDMVCGEFLLSKKSTGQLADFDVEQALKTVTTGDTTVTFDTTVSQEKQLNSFLNYLMTYGKGQIICYRTLKW